ncbi:MAG TPA: GNAT family N-acetyltransferase [Candidatus Merdivicinus excrementipullorum]|uniref:GNAT family N-acetyltransferase n=1 Tax=Candidatus Merdivicinus excrementipullorum TaxID=2840867 RepID=A0A9D1FL32_9FIRM|nr:GNAT family N-acetyltransferase [Candidatus Merdivicinus excrementipullorum]
MTTNSIETERLLIRSIREEDGEFCLSMWLDEEMGKYLSDPPRDKADEAELNFAQGIEEQEGWYPFVAELKSTGERMATCSLVPSEDGKTWDLGYCVHRDYWRQGFAAEMIAALIEEAYRRGGRSFTAAVAKENAGSNAVLRKLGFSIEKEGSFRKRGTDIVYPEYIYRLDLE